MKACIVSLLILSVWVVKRHNQPFASLNTKSYDELFLVLNWPKSFSNTTAVQCPMPMPDYFTVHGLWAQLEGRPVTGRIGANNFNLAQLRPSTVEGLNRYWPSLKANNLNEEFWKYEYEKHGSCISPFHNDQDRYFSEALKVAENSNLGNVLSNAGIHYGSRRLYKIKDIAEAIKNAIGVQPMVEWNVASDGTPQLYQIYLRLDTSFKLKDCQDIHFKCPLLNGKIVEEIAFPCPCSQCPTQSLPVLSD